MGLSFPAPLASSVSVPDEATEYVVITSGFGPLLRKLVRRLPLGRKAIPFGPMLSAA